VPTAPPGRLQYLDWLRGIAVFAMILAHVSDSWTAEPYRRGDPWYIVAFVGGVASPLFLFLAGVAIAMSASAKGAHVARRRGWEVFALGLLFRVQSQILGMGPLDNLFKVDMLNIMGLSMVAASYVWQVSGDRGVRVATFAALTTAITMTTPIVRDVTWLAPLPDPIEAYLRPEGHYAAFPFFPWGGFLFGGVIVGDLVHGVRLGRVRDVMLQNGLAVCGGLGVALAWFASFRPSIYESASFWHDSPTFFFIRLGLVALLVPIAWVVEQLLAKPVFTPMVTLGKSSLFVYWVHIELVYGVIAEPIKRTLPLWGALTATALLALLMYGLVLLKNAHQDRLRKLAILRQLRSLRNLRRPPSTPSVPSTPSN
jgi:uncharacterized membrane protein